MFVCLKKKFLTWFFMFSLLFLGGSCCFNEKQVFANKTEVKSTNNVNETDCMFSEKEEEFRNLFAKYCLARYDFDVKQNLVDDELVEKLAKKLREFSTYLKQNDIKPEILDDSVREFIEKNAGNFKGVEENEFKSKIAEGQNKCVFWQSDVLGVAEKLASGQFKLDLNYDHFLRGVKNFYGSADTGLPSCDLRDVSKIKGGAVKFGGLFLTTNLDEIKAFDCSTTNYCCFYDCQKAGDLDIKMTVPQAVVGFVLDLEKAKTIDFKVLKQLVCRLQYKYPTEFGFVDEFLKFKEAIDKRIDKKTGDKNKKNRKNSKETCGFLRSVDVELAECFDYVTQIEKETQKELFDKTQEDFCREQCERGDDCGNTYGINSYWFEVDNELYRTKLFEKFKEANKKSHLTNETFYLLKNYGLLAKLLGYDAVLLDETKDYYPQVRRKPYSEMYVVNAKNVYVCRKLFKSRAECESVVSK